MFFYYRDDANLVLPIGQRLRSHCAADELDSRCLWWPVSPLPSRLRGSMLTGSRMTLVTIWWFVSAHKWFKGPVINVEVKRTPHAHINATKANSSSIICSAEKTLLSTVSKEARTAIAPSLIRRPSLKGIPCLQLRSGRFSLVAMISRASMYLLTNRSLYE